VVDPQSGHELSTEGSVTGVLCIRKPWPGLARTIYGDHARYVQTYLGVYPGFVLLLLCSCRMQLNALTPGFL
jgi:acetyl-CoA synthetase